MIGQSIGRECLGPAQWQPGSHDPSRPGCPARSTSSPVVAGEPEEDGPSPVRGRSDHVHDLGGRI